MVKETKQGTGWCHKLSLSWWGFSAPSQKFLMQPPALNSVSVFSGMQHRDRNLLQNEMPGEQFCFPNQNRLSLMMGVPSISEQVVGNMNEPTSIWTGINPPKITSGECIPKCWCAGKKALMMMLAQSLHTNSLHTVTWDRVLDASVSPGLLDKCGVSALPSADSSPDSTENRSPPIHSNGLVHKTCIGHIQKSYCVE